MLETIKAYLDATVEAIKADAAEKNQSIPPLRVEATEVGGKVISSDYFKYLVLGRGPGKAPPPENMLAWVNKNPETSSWTDIEKKSLAYQIGQKIAKHGTDIFQGKRPGLDFLGAMDKNMDPLLQAIGRNEAVKFLTALKADLNVINSNI